jgi:hypothetical protein
MAIRRTLPDIGHHLSLAAAWRWQALVHTLSIVDGKSQHFRQPANRF